MTIRLLLTFALFFGLSTSIVKAQTTTLWLLNGKKISVTRVDLISSVNEDPSVIFQNLKGKTKSKSVDEVFLYTLPDGAEKIIYQYNPEIGNELQVDQMREFLTGKKQLWDDHKANGYLFGGIASGLAGVLIPPVRISTQKGTLYVPIALALPISYVIVSGNITLSPDQIKARYPQDSDSEYYIMGAQEGVEKKQLKKSLIGTGIGLLAGMLIHPFIY